MAFHTVRQSRVLLQTLCRGTCARKYLMDRRSLLSANRCCSLKPKTALVGATRMCNGTTHSSSQEGPYFDNMVLPSMLVSTEFKEEVTDFAKSVGVEVQDVNEIIPAFLHKSYLITHGKELKNKYKSSEQLALLGLQTIKRLISEYLFLNFPHLPAHQLWDVQNGILENIAHTFAEDAQLMKLIAFKSQVKESMAFQTVLSLVATVYQYEGPGKAREVVQSYMIHDLTDEQIQEMTKLQHPKFIIIHLSEVSGSEPLKTKVLNTERSKSSLHLDDSYTHTVGVFEGENCIAQATSHTLEKAEMKACQRALIDSYPDKLKDFSFSYDSEEFQPEEQINLGLLSPDQRVIELDKAEESFGFNIKGGEKKRLKNEQWLVFHYYSPVFISSITPGGPAERHGELRAGDVLLAVNDRSLVGLEHAQAVKILKSATGSVSLTVTHSQEVLKADEVETNYKMMKRRKYLAELTSEVWAEWHQAQAHKNPAKYAHVLEPSIS